MALAAAISFPFLSLPPLPVLPETAPLLLLLAVLMDVLIGGLWLRRWLPDPAAGMAFLAVFFERRLNREKRGPRARQVRGLLVALVLLLAAVVFGYSLDRVLDRAMGAFAAGPGMGGWLALAVLFLSLRLRQPIALLRRQGALLGRGDVAAGRRLLLATGLQGGGKLRDKKDHGRPAETLDAHGVARLAIGAAGAAFVRRFVGPAFWYLLFGFAGLFASLAVSAMAAVIGTPLPRHRHFGEAARRLDLILGFVPSWLGGLLFALGALIAATAAPGRAFAALGAPLPPGLSGRGAARALAVLAAALGLSLGGPMPFGGHIIAQPWLGEGRARASVADMGRGAYLLAVSGLIAGGLIAGLAGMGLAP